MRFEAARLFNSLKATIPDLKATVVIFGTGEFEFHRSPGFDFDADTFAAEYTTLFRIAQRTAEDTELGDASEQILITERSVLLARRIRGEGIAVFLCGTNEHLGRLRYEVRMLIRKTEQYIA